MMEVTIDKFGRILIPKKIREALGLKPGQVLELFFDRYSRKLDLKLPADADSMNIIVEDSGLPVIQNGSPTTEDFDTVSFIKETREKYLDKKMGLK
jgi:AbrB family looped-hinge helix DNA binding protein